MRYFKVSRNDSGKGFLYYMPSEEIGKFKCWMPLDEDLYIAIEKLLLDASQFKERAEKLEDENATLKQQAIFSGEIEKQLEDRIEQDIDKLSALQFRLDAADEVYNHLKYIWERSTEAIGACYVSTMERGEIEQALEKYNSLKG